MKALNQKGIIGKPGSDKNGPLGDQGMTVDSKMPFSKSKRHQALHDRYLAHFKEEPVFSLMIK